jgi:hypothetical protein
MGVFEHIGRGVVVYVFLFIVLRFAGPVLCQRQRRVPDPKHIPIP